MDTWPPPTDEQAELIDLVARLGRERFEPRARRWDRDAIFPTDNYDDLRAAGLLALCIPKEHGGLGADLRTYCLVAAELGRWCATTALTFNMHSSAMLWSGPLADEVEMTPPERAGHNERRARHYCRVVDQAALYAQPFSEGATSASGRDPFGTTATPVEGGWLVNGRKVFASLSGAATHYGVLCTETGAGQEELDPRNTLYVAVPADSPGFAITGEWDPLGMRGTVSRTLEFHDVFVPDGEQLLPRGVYFRAAIEGPYMFFTLAPTYVGLATASDEFTVDYLRGEVDGEARVRRSSPTKQLAVAEMRIKLEQLRSLFDRVIAEAHVSPGRDERIRMLAANYTIMEGANDLCRLAIRTCGGHSIQRRFPLERYYRDSRCGSLMLPFTAEICLERIGRDALYQPGERD
ncbi:MAG: hypothetical protein QOJ19_3975 [Acidimicrobiia bacterium]|nr:hypothetical protein [Acidimicrobiia bacterium]